MREIGSLREADPQQLISSGPDVGDFEMSSQMFSEKFSRLATPYATTLNNSENDSTLFSEMLGEKLVRLARPLKALNSDDTLLFSTCRGGPMSPICLLFIIINSFEQHI